MMSDNAGRLEVLCLKPYLNKNDVLSFLSGYESSQGDGYNERAVTDLITGEKLLARKAKDVIQRWNDVKAIWEASQHNKPDKELELDPTHVDLMVPKEYLHKWVKQRGNTGASFPKVFCGYRECLRVALEKRWVVVKDLEVSSLGTDQTPDARQAKPVKRQDPKFLHNRKTTNYGYFQALEEILADACAAGTPIPKPEDVYDLLVEKKPRQVEFNVENQTLKYLNQNGEESRPTTLKAISLAIRKRTDPL